MLKKEKSTATHDGMSVKRCRDLFTSLKKACQNIEISFWDYLHDRIFKINNIPQLSEVLRKRYQPSKPDHPTHLTPSRQMSFSSCKYILSISTMSNSNKFIGPNFNRYAKIKTAMLAVVLKTLRLKNGAYDKACSALSLSFFKRKESSTTYCQ